MLEVDDLLCLDALVWLQSGSQAGDFLGVHQSTISRRSRHCLSRLGLTVEQCAPGSPKQSLQELLWMERQLHQRIRLRGGAPLRLLANLWARSHLLEPMPEGWIAPGAQLVAPPADPLGLLEARIVDAALLSGPEARGLDPGHWQVLDLSVLPLQLLVPRHHPLARERLLGPADLLILAPLTFAPFVPRSVQAVMAQLHGRLAGTGGVARASRRHGAPCMATAFTRQHWPDHVPLDVDLPVRASDHLVLLADLPLGARLESLLLQLRCRLLELRAATPGLACLID